MTVKMEFIFELLAEIFLEGCIDAAGSRRLPKAVRGLLLSVPFVLLELLFVWGAVSGFSGEKLFLALFCSALAVLFLALWIYLLVQIKRNKP